MDAGRPARLGTCAEADQPVSTGLYAALGLAPRTPLYLLRGAMAPGDPAGSPARASRPVALARTRRRGPRPDGPARLPAAGRPRLLRPIAPSGLGGGRPRAARSSGTATSSRADGSGRSRCADPDLMAGLVGHLARSVVVPDGWQASCRASSCALPLLLAHGLRIDATPAVYCADRAGPDFDRYLPTSFALL